MDFLYHIFVSFPFGTVQSFVRITSAKNLNSNIIECDIANKVENNKMAMVCVVYMFEGEVKEKKPAVQNSIDQMDT